MKTNKEIIEALTEYFMTQDPKIIARSLASFSIDFTRIDEMKKLPASEKICLLKRIKANANQVRKFVKNGYQASELIIENKQEFDDSKY